MSAGFAGPEAKRPHLVAVVDPTPKNEPHIEPREGLSSYEPYWAEHEGEFFDVHNFDDAWNYLEKVRGKELVRARGWLDKVTGGHYSHEMDYVERAAKDEAGKPQSDAVHTYIGSDMSPIMLETMDIQDVDGGRASKMFVRHDRLEVLAGDTSVFDEEAKKTKGPRETAAKTIMDVEDEHTPGLAALDKEYDEALTPTARWAHGVDGVEPGYQALKTKAALQKSRPDKLDEMSEKQFEKTIVHGATFAISLGTQLEIARKWDDWGCKPYQDGDNIELVLSTAKRIFKEQASPIQEREYAHARIKIMELYGVELPELTLDPETEKARQMGAIVITDWLANKSRPDRPPTPSSPIGSLALAAN
jgi:hypothetical protein